LPAPRDLNPGEWAVLALCDEAPAHGFALARALAPDGDVGRVWAVPRPLVYRALRRLQDDGLLTPAGTEDSPAGPPRTVYRATPAARRRLDGWLQEPVEHVRDARHLLLLKLLFLHRRGRPADTLVAAQAAAYGTIEQRLEDRIAAAEGFDRTLLAWRLESARAAMRFLEAFEADQRAVSAR
jgi:PadR family transcriptional regulator AphA